MRDCQGVISGCNLRRIRMTDDEKAQTRRLTKHWEELTNRAGGPIAALAAKRAEATIAARKEARARARHRVPTKH